MPVVDEKKCAEAMDVMKDWDTWMNTLRQGLDLGRGLGMSENELKEISRGLLDYITEEFCPSTDEQKILKDMWSVSTPEERRTLVEIFFKLMEEEK